MQSRRASHCSCMFTLRNARQFSLQFVASLYGSKYTHDLRSYSHRFLIISTFKCFHDSQRAYYVPCTKTHSLSISTKCLRI